MGLTSRHHPTRARPCTVTVGYRWPAWWTRGAPPNGDSGPHVTSTPGAPTAGPPRPLPADGAHSPAISLLLQGGSVVARGTRRRVGGIPSKRRRHPDNDYHRARRRSAPATWPEPSGTIREGGDGQHLPSGSDTVAGKGANSAALGFSTVGDGVGQHRSREATRPPAATTARRTGQRTPWRSAGRGGDRGMGGGVEHGGRRRPGGPGRPRPRIPYSGGAESGGHVNRQPKPRRSAINSVAGGAQT